MDAEVSVQQEQLSGRPCMSDPVDCSVASTSACFSLAPLAPSIHPLLRFFDHIGQLKATSRTGWLRFGLQPCESVADHMYRMAVMAMVLVGLPAHIDRNRCVQLCLTHDLAECIVGDITPFCGVDVQEKHRREKEAIVAMCALLDEYSANEKPSPKNDTIITDCRPTDIESGFAPPCVNVPSRSPATVIEDLYNEYESRSTDEALFVKDLDRLDMLLQAFEYERFRANEIRPPEGIGASGCAQSPSAHQSLQHTVFNAGSDMAPQTTSRGSLVGPLQMFFDNTRIDHFHFDAVRIVVQSLLAERAEYLSQLGS